MHQTLRNILIVCLIVVCLPCLGFSQAASEQVYALPPLLKAQPKIYILKESDLSRYQMPQNYMIVRNTKDKTVVLWEFPAEISKIEAPVPAPVAQGPLQKPEKTPQPAQEKPKISDEVSPSGLDKALETLSKAGLDPKQLNKILSNVEELKNTIPRPRVIGEE